MEQSENKITDTKENLKLFVKNNLSKIISILIVFIIIIVSFFVWKENQDKKNFLISEKYIKAGILLGNGENESATNYYKEIILSENKFYSVLALNTILEKNLIEDNIEILNLFEKLEKLNLDKKNTDLILFKKALYFSKIDQIEKSKILLNKLIEQNSSLKELALNLLEN